MKTRTLHDGSLIAGRDHDGVRTRSEQLARATTAVVRVGDGRGVLIDRGVWPSYVITAAHCLPQLPPVWSTTRDRTYDDLLGPLDVAPTVWAECLFVDALADLAVLGSPDAQVVRERADAYEAFVGGRQALGLAALTHGENVQILAPDGLWKTCSAEMGAHGRTMIVVDAHIMGGMAGSPILDATGRTVVGLISRGLSNHDVEARVQPQPAVVINLPTWLLADLLFEPLGHVPQLIAAQRRAWERYVTQLQSRSAEAAG